METHAPTFHLGPTKEEVKTPKTLVDLYLGGDYRKLYADVLSRPQHYTERQQVIIKAKYLGQTLSPEPTEAEINGLVDQLVRTTEAEEKYQAIVKKVEKKDVADDAILLGPDGQPIDPDASFETQDFGKLIPIL